jgi:RNA polymerase sigma-70 factor (ECF subfamily)
MMGTAGMSARAFALTETRSTGHAPVVGTSSLALSLDPNEPPDRPRAPPDVPTLTPPPPPKAATKALSGAHLGFDHVYEQTFDFAWRSARRLGVAASAVDDIVQDAFVVVHRRLPEFEGRSSLKTWIFGILLRVVSDHRRTLRRKGGLSELPHEDVLASSGALPTDALEKREAADLLHALLDELDDEKRTVFVLAELEELAAPEIAEALGIPVNTVYSRLRAAREGFERSLARHRAREQSAPGRARSKERA